MKRTLPFVLFVGSMAPALAQTVLINENFDSYSVGAEPATVNPTAFAIWPGGNDQVVSDSLAHSGNNSMLCLSTSAANGGPGDLLLLLGDKTAGSYTLSWWMYVPAGFGGYFNLQHTEDVSTPSFGAEVIFEDAGVISGTANNTAIAGSYPQDSWFMVLLAIDLQSSMAVLTVNSAVVTTWPFNTATDGSAAANQLGAIDFFSYGGGGSTLGNYFVDDILYTDLNVGIAERASADLSTYPNPVTGILTVKLPGTGASPEVALLDASGRTVEQGRAFSVVDGSMQMAIDMSGLPAGVYTLRVLENGKVITRKVVKS